MAQRLTRNLLSTGAVRTRGISTARATSISVPTMKSLKECTAEEWHNVSQEYETKIHQKVGDTLIALIQSHRGDDKRFGFAVDLYEHGLQTATRAFKDGASDELVVGALFHDAAELLAPYNHAQVVGQMLYPYVSPETFWILSHHDIFQSFYYLHHYGVDAEELKRKFRDHEHYDATVHFCEHWDQAAFDANYESKDMQFFRPMIDRVFAQQPFWWNDGVNPQTGMGTLMQADD